METILSILGQYYANRNHPIGTGIERIHAMVGIAEADFAPHPGTKFFFESRYIERHRRGRAGLHAMVYLGGRDLGRDTNEGLGHFRFDRRHNGYLNTFVASLNDIDEGG